MKISIIVTNHKTPELLKLCLESIKKAGQDLVYEIVVADSESQEEAQDMMREFFPEIKVLAFKKNTSYAKLINSGLAELKSKGDYTLILNADMVLSLDSLKKMIEYLEEHQDVGLLGPQLLNFDDSIQDSCFRFHRFYTIPLRRTFLGKTTWGKKELERFTMSDFDRTSTKEVGWVLGAALMIRQESLDEVGAIDERYFLYLEDTDWCRRFWEAGWKVVYFPGAKMYHYHGRMSKKAGGLVDLFVNKYTWIHIASALRYFWKFRSKPLPIK